MTTHPTRNAGMIWPLIEPRLVELAQANVSATTRNAIAGAVQHAKSAVEGAANQMSALKNDRDLSREGKRVRADKLASDARTALEQAKQVIEQAVKTEADYHRTRAAWPRSAGTDADREARLANARTDLQALLANVPPAHRAQRLAFAVRNGTDAMRELILGEKYAERVLWPSLEEGQLDAVTWASERTALLQELHPSDDARRSLAALDALEGRSGAQIDALVKHGASMDEKYLTEVMQDASSR